MKLYSMVPQDCSGKVRWLLMELGIEFEDVKMSYRAGDLKSDSYLSKNPVSQVPVLEDGDTTISESYAIVTYLADKHLENGLAPDPTNLEERALYYHWMFFSCNTAEDFFNRLLNLPKMSEEYRGQWEDYIREKVQMVMSAIDKQLKGREYIMGQFSAVDTCLGCALDAVAEEVFIKDFPNVYAYYKRLSQRKACLRSEIFKRS